MTDLEVFLSCFITFLLGFIVGKMINITNFIKNIFKKKEV